MKTKRKRGGKPTKLRLHKPGDEGDGLTTDNVKEQEYELSWEDMESYKGLMKYCAAYSNNENITHTEMEMLEKYYRELRKTIVSYVNPTKPVINIKKSRQILESLKVTAKRIIDETEGKEIRTLNFHLYDMYDTIDIEEQGESIIKFFLYLSELFLSTDDEDYNSFEVLKNITGIMERLDLNQAEKKNVKRVLRKKTEIGKWNAISDIFYYFLSKGSPAIRSSRKSPRKSPRSSPVKHKKSPIKHKKSPRKHKRGTPPSDDLGEESPSPSSSIGDESPDIVDDPVDLPEADIGDDDGDDEDDDDDEDVIPSRVTNSRRTSNRRTSNRRTPREPTPKEPTPKGDIPWWNRFTKSKKDKSPENKSPEKKSPKKKKTKKKPKKRSKKKKTEDSESPTPLDFLESTYLIR